MKHQLLQKDNAPTTVKTEMARLSKALHFFCGWGVKNGNRFSQAVLIILIKIEFFIRCCWTIQNTGL